MDATKTKLIVYDDCSKDARPTGTTGAQWPGWSYPAFNVTAHDGSGKSGEPGSAATTAVAYLKKCDNRTDIIIRNKTELQGWQHRGVKGVTNSVIR